MNWSIFLSSFFLLLIIFLNFFTKKRESFKKLRTIIPHLFILLFISLLISLLKIDFIADLFYSEELIFILLLALLFFALILAVKFIVFLLFDFLFAQRQKIKYPRLIKDIVVIMLYVIGILFIVNYYLNIKITVLLASSAVLTVVIGFALQDLLGDLFSGIALNLEESLKIGDWIKIGEYEGKIEQFRWRSIKIKTIDNILVLIPNQVASKQEVRNFGHRGESFALRTQIGTHYKDSPDLVINTLLKVMDSVDLIIKRPEPVVYVNRFDDFSIVYELKFYIKDYARRFEIDSEIKRKSWYAFKRLGIVIPFPIRDVYMKEPLRNAWEEENIVDILKKNDLFSTLDEQQLIYIAKEAHIKIYAQGEVLIKEGEIGSHFFHILSGEVVVTKNNKMITKLGANDYVGELSLFTGEKTTADVLVSKESKILKISSKEFHETVKINKKMAAKLSEVIAIRKAKLMEFEKEKPETLDLNIKKDSENIFRRIIKYFSL
jgi:small-conductance mechanosensitive channel